MSTKVITVSYNEGQNIDELDGLEVVAVLHNNLNQNRARLLVKANDGKGEQQTLEMVDAKQEVEVTPEELAEAYKEQAARDAEVTCAGKGGECSRKVDAEGDRCWQHAPEEESS